MVDSALTKQLLAWHSGLKAEVDFWDDIFARKGGMWPEDFQRRLDPNLELQGYLVEGLKLDGKLPRILDVGAGPMTIMGKKLDGRAIDLTPSDPLAPFYAKIAKKHSVIRPIPTVQAFAEDLSSFFEPASFDVVFCSNALDHSFDPVRGIEEMFLVAKPNGRIVLQHGINEAEHCNWDNMHQWNFTNDGPDFICWNRTSRVNVSKQFSQYATSIVRTYTENGDRAISVIFDKFDHPKTNLDNRRKDRIQELLASVLMMGAVANDVSV